MHGRFSAERDAILRALLADTKRRWVKRTLKMADCCSTPAVGLTPSGCPNAIWFRCRDRLCPLCAHARSGQVTERVLVATRDADALRFLTLTVAASNEPLRDQMDRLTARYKALRKTDEWKAHVRGAIATIEVTLNAETGKWHPHLHVLADGTFWDQRSISRTWERVTGDSPIVYIEAVRGRGKVAKYVAKYAAKPGDIAQWPAEAINEYAAAIHRRRMLIATGTMHGKSGDCDGDTEDRTISGGRIPLHAIERRANTGCERAALLLTALASQSAQYQASLSHRRPGQGVRLAAFGDAVRADVRAIWSDLETLWRDDAVLFVMGGSGDWVKPPKLKPPPGRGRCKNCTEPIADWHHKETRHI